MIAGHLPMHASNLPPRIFARLGVHYGSAIVSVIFLTMLATSAVMGMVGVLMLRGILRSGWDRDHSADRQNDRPGIWSRKGPIVFGWIFLPVGVCDGCFWRRDDPG